MAKENIAGGIEIDEAVRRIHKGSVSHRNSTAAGAVGIGRQCDGRITGFRIDQADCRELDITVRQKRDGSATAGDRSIDNNVF